MENEILEYRMYGLVPYNLSPIQQGIQFGHAVVEYGIEYNNSLDYAIWAMENKTFIILNGGTTNDNAASKFYGTMNQHLDTLQEAQLEVAPFYEPDLGDQLSAIVFIVDERVYDKKKYPFFKQWLETFVKGKLPECIDYVVEYPDRYIEWVNFIGGNKNVFLREFLRQFKLA